MLQLIMSCREVYAQLLCQMQGRPVQPACVDELNEPIKNNYSLTNTSNTSI